jgi:hypothetical protein
LLTDQLDVGFHRLRHHQFNDGHLDILSKLSPTMKHNGPAKIGKQLMDSFLLAINVIVMVI